MVLAQKKRHVLDAGRTPGYIPWFWSSNSFQGMWLNSVLLIGGLKCVTGKNWKLIAILHDEDSGLVEGRRLCSELADSKLEKNGIISRWAFWLEGERWLHQLAAFCVLVPAGSSSEAPKETRKLALLTQNCCELADMPKVKRGCSKSKILEANTENFNNIQAKFHGFGGSAYQFWSSWDWYSSCPGKA